MHHAAAEIKCPAGCQPTRRRAGWKSTSDSAHRRVADNTHRPGGRYHAAEDWQIVFGTWIFQVWDQDRMLAEKSFTMVNLLARPGDLAAPAPASESVETPGHRRKSASVVVSRLEEGKIDGRD